MSFLKTTAIQHLNGSSPSIYLNSTGNVGVGNTSPAGKLQVSGGPLFLDDPNNAVIYSSGAQGGFYFRSGNPGSYLDTMVINNSGYITKPYQPSFLVTKDDGGSALAGGQTVLFNTIAHNIGGCYSASTGRFTAPIAGRYFFSSFMLGAAGGTNTGQSFFFNLNGGSSGFHPYTRSTGADYVGWSGSCIFNLSAGDYISIYLSEGPIYATGARHNGFTGYLLG